MGTGTGTGTELLEAEPRGTLATMRYAIASLVALLLSATLFVFHWWVWLAVGTEAGKSPLEDMQVKLPKHVEAMLSWDDSLYGLRFILIPVFFAVCLGVAWHTRNRLQVR